jgi:hypothetical protein
MRLLTKADYWLIGLLLLLAVGGIGLGMSRLVFPGEQTLQAEISVDGKLVQSIPLRQGYRQEIRLGDGTHYNVVEVDSGRIRIRQADCLDQICVQTGWINAAPQQIVCLPNRVVIKISAAAADIDDITR